MIRLDGAAIDQWDPDALGRSIGYLPQDIEMFDGTIAEKQLVGWAGITAERLHRFLGPSSSVAEVRRLHPLFNPAAYVESRLAARDDVVT